ncbi:MAG: hypothetical protein WBD73_03380 [Candidatus Acidiferrales bacterium]
MNDSVFLLSEQELAPLTLEEKAEYCSPMKAGERQRAQLQLRISELSQRMDPTPRQLDFRVAARRHKYALYGGAAGGGKSYFVRWWLVDFLCRIFRDFGARHVRVGLFCEDYNSLRDRQLSKMKFELPSWPGAFRETREEGYAFHLSEEFGGGILCPRNLDDPATWLQVLKNATRAIFQAAAFAQRAVDYLHGFQPKQTEAAAYAALDFGHSEIVSRRVRPGWRYYFPTPFATDRYLTRSDGSFSFLFADH